MREPKTITFWFYQRVLRNIEKTISDFRHMTKRSGNTNGPENWGMVRNQYLMAVALRDEMRELVMALIYWDMASYKRSHGAGPWYVVLTCIMANRMIRKQFGMDSERNASSFER